MYTYMTAVLNKCMEVLYIHHMKVRIEHQVYRTKTFIFPVGGEWTASFDSRTVPMGGRKSRTLEPLAFDE